MHASRPASLLVAALVMLRHPCSRNKATARLLLSRAALSEDLSVPERDACQSLADDLEIDVSDVGVRPSPPAARPSGHSEAAAAPRAGDRRAERHGLEVW